MDKKVIKVSELRKVIHESKNEFKPVYGKDVESKNKSINADAYKEIGKETEAYDKGLGKKMNDGEYVTPANNRGMSDLEYDSISTPFKEKVRTQLKGYPSKQAEKLHKDDAFGNADFGSDEPWVSHAEEAKKEHDKSKTDGLVSSKYKKETEKAKETIGESKTIDKLKFKKTEFMSENHALSKVPDSYKVNNRRFMMEDCEGNRYIIEWDDKKPNVTKCVNEKKVNEELNKIKSLYGYNSKDFFKNTTVKSRVNESTEFSNMLDRARKLMK